MHRPASPLASGVYLLHEAAQLGAGHPLLLLVLPAAGTAATAAAATAAVAIAATAAEAAAEATALATSTVSHLQGVKGWGRQEGE